MALMQLTGGIAPGAVDHAAPLHGRALGDGVGPALHVDVFLHAQEFAGAIQQAFRQAAVPGPDGDVRDRIFAAGEIFVVLEAPVEHVELAFHLHGEPIDRVFDLFRSVGVEVAETATEIRRAAHLPEQHDRHSARVLASVGSNAPNFSARCIRIEPDSNTLIGVDPLWSISAGIFEFGLTATKPLPNWLPSILISQASYSAPLYPRASNSSSITVTLTPFGVASE